MYDDSCRYIGRARLATVDALGLSPGQTVFDVACGTGTVLPILAERVGRDGVVIGIDHSPEMAHLAGERVRKLASAGRVASVESSVEDVVPPGKADALLFCNTHDVRRAPRWSAPKGWSIWAMSER